MKAELFTRQDAQLLRSWKIAPGDEPAFNEREKDALIRQLRTDLEASEAELRICRRAEVMKDAMVLKYCTLDAKHVLTCREMERLRVAQRRVKRLAIASGVCLAGGAAFWGIAVWAWPALRVTFGG